VSGHSASGDDLDYARLAAAPGTLVVFMGLAHLAAIAGGLVAGGKDPRTPASVVSRGTLPDGRSVSGELGEIAALARGLESPVLLVVGDVVAVGGRLARLQRRVAAAS
jgi:siroheme synthase